MGFTVGSGGSSIIAEGAVTADKIADGAVSPEKLDGTGTPGATTYYRGDGAWETPAGGGEPTQHGRYSNASKGSTNDTVIQFPSAIGTPSTSDFTHNSDYATQGSVFTCVSSGWFHFDVVIMLTAGGKGINLIKNSAVSNNVDEGTKLSAETSAGAGYANALSTIRYIESGEVVYVGIGGGGALSDAGAQNISYNRILITRITGPGATGETGPAGPAGAGAITPSYARYSGVAARGSTNTNVWRFSTVHESSGSDLTYGASATDGDSFTVNTSGVYAIFAGGTTSPGAMYLFVHAGAAINNLNDPTADTTFRALAAIGGGQSAPQTSWVGYVPAGHKIWVSSDVAPYNAAGYEITNTISIARVN